MSVMEDTAFLMITSRELAMGLAALLLSIPPLRHVERLKGPEAVLERLNKGRQPALVVLDSDTLGLATMAIVQSVRDISPETRTIVLSDSVAESRQLTSDGVESVVVKGMGASSLVDAIESLLSDGAIP